MTLYKILEKKAFIDSNLGRPDLTSIERTEFENQLAIVLIEEQDLKSEIETIKQLYNMKE